MRWEDLTLKQRSNPRELFNIIMTQIDKAKGNTEQSFEGESDEGMEEDEPLEVATVSVTVRDTEDNPVGNAKVTLTNDETIYTGTTGSAGGCNIKNVPYGNYTVDCTADDYNDYMGSLIVDAIDVDLNITIEAEIEFSAETPSPMMEEEED